MTALPLNAIRMSSSLNLGHREANVRESRRRIVVEGGCLNGLRKLHIKDGCGPSSNWNVHPSLGWPAEFHSNRHVYAHRHALAWVETCMGHLAGHAPPLVSPAVRLHWLCAGLQACMWSLNMWTHVGVYVCRWTKVIKMAISRCLKVSCFHFNSREEIK